MAEKHDQESQPESHEKENEYRLTVNTQQNEKSIPRFSGRQYRRVRNMVRSCCNYDGGSCLLQDDGNEHECTQNISRSLICKYFRKAVLPDDKQMEAELLHRAEQKQCESCGALFLPGGNHARYCPECAVRIRRRRAAMRKRKQRQSCHALAAEKGR